MIEDLTASQVAERLASDAAPLLVDVREPWEREAAAIPGSLHIPMAEIPQRLGELPADRDVVVYCHHGARSMRVASWLAQQGYHRVANLSGGIDGWSLQVDQTIPRYR